jgi:voltage-gated potassium channel Kch
LIGNPLILMTIMGILGYTKKTSLKTGFTVAQISEFSLILIAIGAHLGHVPPDVVMLVTMVGLITIFGSTYLVMYSDQIYSVLSPYLSIFERKRTKNENNRRKKTELIVFGAGDLSQPLLQHIKNEKIPHLIVDHDPDVIKKLHGKRMKTLYAEADNISLIEGVPFSEAKMTIITLTDIEAASTIAQLARSMNPEIIIIARARTALQAHELYDQDVDYVITPTIRASQYVVDLFEKNSFSREKYEAKRKHHLDLLTLVKGR